MGCQGLVRDLTTNLNDSTVTKITGDEIDELNEVGGPGVPHPTR